jgi:hypothetical protein
MLQSMGFKIKIQKDLSMVDQKTAFEFANEWISKTCKQDLVYHLGGKTGGYRSYLCRGTFGYLINQEKQLVFRRISHSKRVFGIVKANTMVQKDNTPIDLNQCCCPRHLGSTPIKWKNGEPPMFTYARVADFGGLE